MVNKRSLYEYKLHLVSHINKYLSNDVQTHEREVVFIIIIIIIIIILWKCLSKNIEILH